MGEGEGGGGGGGGARAVEPVFLASERVDLCRPPLHRCGAGRAKISVDVDGALYPCQLLHEEPFRLGHVLDFATLNEAVSARTAVEISRYTADRIDHVPECRNCDVRHFCGGGCVVSNVADSLPVDQRPPYCHSVRAFYRAVVWQWRNDRSFGDNLARIVATLSGAGTVGQGAPKAGECRPAEQATGPTA